MTIQEWAIAALRAAAYTLGLWAALWLFAMPDHHPQANWFCVWIVGLASFWDGRTNKKEKANA